MKLSELIKKLKEIKKTEDDLVIFRKNFCSHYGETESEVEDIIVADYGRIIFK